MRDLEKPKEALREAKRAAFECFLELDALLYKKEMTEVLQRDCFTPLKEGTVDTPSHIRKKINSLVPLALLQVSPGVLAKPPAERRPLDLVVLQQLEEALSKHLTKVIEQLELLSRAVREHEAAVEVAEDSAMRAQKKCEVSKESKKASMAQNLVCRKILRSAEKALQEFRPEYEAVVATRDVAIERLATFSQHSWLHSTN